MTVIVAGNCDGLSHSFVLNCCRAIVGQLEGSQNGCVGQGSAGCESIPRERPNAAERTGFIPLSGHAWPCVIAAPARSAAATATNSEISWSDTPASRALSAWIWIQ